MNLRSFSILLLCTALASHRLAAQVKPEQPESRINREILDSIYCKIVGNYVEPVDPAKIVNTGVKAMLAALDPFSNYYDQAETKEAKLASTAHYGGIGCVFAPAGDKIYVSRVREGYAGFRAGIRPGDTILSINHSPIMGKPLDDVIDLVRGTPGTSLAIGFRHMGQTRADSANLQREEIRIKAVPYYGVLGQDIGYIALVRESANSAGEVKQALTDLQSNHHLKGLILDLRNNEGGYVTDAIKIAGFFLNTGDTLLLTRSARDSSTDVSISRDAPVDRNTPLIVLVNENTISSGEIISGALQDHDRGVILGQRTFGKGLVQKVYDLPYQTMLTLTREYYYTPSGRCIESARYSGTRTANAGIAAQDSAKRLYRTKKGRPVYDFGGIAPDVLFESPRPSPIAIKLTEGDKFYAFALQYKTGHATIPQPVNFHLSDKDYDSFIASLRNSDIGYQPETEKKLQELQKAANAEGRSAEVNAAIANLRLLLAQAKTGDLAKNKEEIRSRLEAAIVSVYYFETGQTKYLLQNDTEIKKAMDILSSKEDYEKVLAPPH